MLLLLAVLIALCGAFPLNNINNNLGFLPTFAASSADELSLSCASKVIKVFDNNTSHVRWRAFDVAVEYVGPCSVLAQLTSHLRHEVKTLRVTRAGYRSCVDMPVEQLGHNQWHYAQACLQF